MAFVEIESQEGAGCKLRNPCGQGAVTLYRDGKQAVGLQGSLIEFGTRRGEKNVLVSGSAAPARFKRTVRA